MVTPPNQAGPGFTQPPHPPASPYTYPSPQGLPGPPQKKKGLSTGCIVFGVLLLCFFGTIAAVMLVLGFAISQNKDAQNIFGAMTDGAEIIIEAQSAPGTDELRALGCEQALAMDPAKIAKIINRFADAGVPPMPAGGGGFEKMVMCQMSAYATPPTCDDVARSYIKGASPRGNFYVQVQQQHHNSPACSGMYTPAGTLVSGP